MHSCFYWYTIGRQLLLMQMIYQCWFLLIATEEPTGLKALSFEYVTILFFYSAMSKKQQEWEISDTSTVSATPNEAQLLVCLFNAVPTTVSLVSFALTSTSGFSETWITSSCVSHSAVFRELIANSSQDPCLPTKPTARKRMIRDEYDGRSHP